MTAFTYGIASILIVGTVLKVQWDEREADLHPHEFTISAPSGRMFIVPAQYDWEAMSAAKDYDAAHLAVTPDEHPGSIQSGVADYEVTSGQNRNYFDDLPIRVPVAKYDHPLSVATVGKRGALAAMWCAIVYAVLWAFFRGLRWIVLGFMEDRHVGA